MSVRGHHIDGVWTGSGSGSEREIVNPSDESVIGVAASGTAEDVDGAVSAARAAAEGWADAVPAERAGILLRFADAIESHADQLAQIELLNVGKPRAAADGEPAAAVDMLRFYAGASRVLTAPASGEYVAGVTAMLRRDPLGVVACIAPWNYPLSTAVAKIAPALAAGNTVVLKPSELTPLSALQMMELASEIFPPGVINLVTGDGDPVGEALARHPGIDMISMTGSTRTGRRIAGVASETLKRVHLELGGNAPVVVFEDAEIDALVQTLRMASFWNSGQECGAASRLIVHRSVLAEVVEEMTTMMATIVVGDPRDEGTEIGPLISHAQRDRVRGLVRAAAENGAEVATGGGDAGKPKGFFFEPTLVVGIRDDDPLVQEETFGPVVTVQAFDTEDEALRLANASPYALSGSVWTKDVSRALRFTRRMRAGTAWVNTHLAFSSELPWGGPGATGGGRDGSALALEDHTRARNVLVAYEG